MRWRRGRVLPRKALVVPAKWSVPCCSCLPRCLPAQAVVGPALTPQCGPRSSGGSSSRGNPISPPPAVWSVRDVSRRAAPQASCGRVVALDGGLNDIFEEGDAVDSLQELKQMFMNIVDPEFYSSACSGKASAPLSQQNNKSHWVNGSAACDELVAQTLFPEGRISGAGLEGSGLDSKSSSTAFCSDVSSSTSVQGKEREGKRQKLCQGRNAVSSPSVECDLSSTLSMDFNFYGGSSENEDWGSTYFL